MQRLLLGATLVWLVFPMADAKDPIPSEDDRLQSAFKAFLDEEFQRRPLSATQAGDHRFDDRLDDVSASALARGKTRLQQALEQLPKKIDYRKLTRAGQ